MIAIGKQRGAAYKRIFEAAQRDLRRKFGMEMVPLPANEKYTVKQKRGMCAPLFSCYRAALILRRKSRRKNEQHCQIHHYSGLRPYEHLTNRI